MTTINLTSEATFIELTRVYKMKNSSTLKNQPMTIALSAVESVRPSNRLGHPDHRSTITLISGQVFDIANKYSDVVAELTASNA